MKAYVAMLVAMGLLTACNQGVKNASNKFNEMPPAAQKTARAQAPNSEIADVTHKTDSGSNYWVVEFRNENGRNPKVVVNSDGQLLNSDFPRTAGAIDRMLTPTGATGTPFSALPEPVQKTIRKQAPNAPIAKIARHDDNGRAIYEVQFEDQGKNPSIRVAEDGTLVQSLQK